MAEQHDIHVDALTGTQTTGHEWDGIRELNNPLPRWWLWIFYICILFSVGYWVVYPSWPLITSHAKGAFGWNSRTQVVEDLQGLTTLRAPMVAKLEATDIADVSSDAQLLDFTLAYGKAAFGDNCAPCHGTGGGGAAGYPNLIDDDWLWGGDIAQIQQTITHGVRNDDPDAHIGDMLAFGRDGILNGTQIANVAGFVRTLSGLEAPAAVDVEAGKQVFAENCASCHGDAGTGDQELGAPNLTDAIWLYGSGYDTIVTTVTGGRAGSMPAWEPRLGATTVKALTVYVHALGGGE